MLLTVEIRGSWADVIVLGPVFSSHAWSIVWEARDWPRIRFNLGVARCVIVGKYPNIFEK